jgi:hypothetical protein
VIIIRRLIFMNVFILQHTHEFEDGEDVKMIGVYSTHGLAEEAIKRIRGLSGFCDMPDGFRISSYEVDVDYWTEGYITVLPDGSEVVRPKK